jgi:hypothetical protein
MDRSLQWPADRADVKSINPPWLPHRPADGSRGRSTFSKVLALWLGVFLATLGSVAQSQSSFASPAPGNTLQPIAGIKPNPANPPVLPVAPTTPVAVGGKALRASVTNPNSTFPIVPGRTEGTAVVSPAGDATYQIPIWTPPGARGLTPKLSLIYVSGTPDSLLGPGWTLGGFSVITRCAPTWAQDHAPGSITLTMADKFCLDGQRLRVSSGTSTYGQPGSTYQTEIADFSSITASSSASGNGPASFTMRGKDGLIYEYGATANSRVFSEVTPGTNATTPYLWALDKVSDRLGNNMTFQYIQGNGSYAPSLITYTQTPATGTSYPHYIYFEYTTRSTGQTVSSYLGGTHVQQTSLLAQILIANDGNFNGDDSYREFFFAYENGGVTGRNRLNGVQDCSQRKCLSPTTISYQDGAAGVATPQTSVGITPDASPRAVDVDGDGKLDLVFPVASGSTEHWYVKFATASGFGSPVDTQIIEPTGSSVLLDDFLASGRTDLLAASGGIWYLLHWTGSGPVNGFTWTPTTASSAVLAAAADIDGDGLPDLVWVDTTTNAIYARLNTLPTGTLFSSTSTLMYTNTTAITGIYGDNGFPHSAVRKLDFNGDGRGDIYVSAGFGEIFVSQGNSFLLFNSSESVTGVPINWNDDACTDWAAGNFVEISSCGSTQFANVPINASGGGTTLASMDWYGDARTARVQVCSCETSCCRRMTQPSSTTSSTLQRH